MSKDRKKGNGWEKENGLQYREMAEAIPGIVYQFVIHPDGSFSVPFISRRVMEYSDRKPEEITGNSSLAFEYVPPEDLEKTWQAIHESARTMENFSIEYRRIPPDGQVTWFRVEGSPLKLPNGDILWNGVALDVTDRKAAEQALKDSEERIRLIAEGIREVFWVGSPDWKQVYYVSPAYENIWGRSVESLYEHPLSWMESLPPEDRRRVNAYTDGLEDGEMTPGVFPEYRVIQKDGSFRWIEARYYPIKNDQGRVYRVVGIAEDITDRKNSEAEIRRLAAIVESSDDAIYVINLNGEIVEWNHGAERLFGYEKSEIVGKPLSVIIPTDAADDLHAILEKVKSDHDIDHFETIRRTNEGKEIHVSLTVSPVKDESGEVVGASAIARDITHRKQIEQERELTIELLSLINREHDLRSLMKAVNEMLQQWSGCEAVGIRLRDGHDYPYYETRGFPASFLRAENRLCVVDSDGRIVRDGLGYPILECMCGNIIQGRFDPSKPFFTANGSFWTNSTTELLASTTEADRLTRTRNLCHGAGYESLALIPLRSGDTSLGLLQFNDSRPDRFDEDKISLFERLANSLALGLAHRIALNRLSESEARYRMLFENAEVLVSIYDRNGTCLLMNNKLAELFGGEPDDLHGKSFHELHPDTAVEYIERIRDVIDTGESREYEDKIKFPNGDRWLLSNVQPVRDAAGLIYAAQIISQDITERKRAELEMQTAADIMRAIPAGLFIYKYEEPDRLILLDSNPEAERLTGIKASEWRGREFDEIWPEAKQRGVTDAYLGVIKTGQMHETEDLFYKDERVDGAFRVRVFTMPDSRLGVAFEDVTQRCKAEAALRESEARFRELFNNMSNIVSIYEAINDGQDFIFKDINDAGSKYYPGDKAGIIGRNILDVFPDLAPLGFVDVFRRVWRTGVAESRPGTLYRDEQIYMWVESYVCKLPSGELVAVYNDITDQKQAEEELKKSEERYRVLFEAANDSIFVEDPKTGQFLDANRAAERLTGYSHREIVGKHRTFLYPPEQHEQIQQLLAEAIEQTDEQLVEVDVVNKEGRRIPVEISTGGLVSIGGRKVRFGIFRDISDRKRAEMEKSQLESQLRQAQKMEAIGTLAGGIAHDFNNILAAIIGYTELALYDTPEGMPVRPNLEQIHRAGQRAKDLVNQILAFSRKADSERQVIQLGPIVKESLKMLRATIPTTIDIKQNIRTDAFMAEADPTQVHQLLINLCTNAADAMQEGGGTLSVELGSKTLDAVEPAIQGDIPPGRYMVLTVKDTGTGIDPQVQLRIFDPFFTTKGVGRGTGMGLSVVHGIVTGHSGYIQVESEPGRGTAFYVYLPARTASPKVDAKTSTASLPMGAGRILFVDDEDALVDFARQMFPRIGYEVTAVNSSSEAYELFRDQPHHFDIVITDLTMPGLTGLELARAIHAQNPDLPIILSTGFSDQISLETLKDSGILHLLNKPIDVKQVARLIYGILGGNESGG